MVCGGGSRDLIWQSADPSSMLDGAQDCEYAGQASVWTAFDLDKSCVWHDDGAQDCEYAGQASVWTAFDLDKSCVWHDDGAQDCEYDGQASVWTAFDLDKSCVWHDDGAQDCEYDGQASVWTEFDLDKSCVWHDDGAQDCEYDGQASVWIKFDLDKSCVWQIEKRKALYCHPVEPCSTPLNIQDGASFGRRKSGVNYLWWLRVVLVYDLALWRPAVSTTVLVDGLHWSHRCLRRICHSFDGMVLEVAQYVDGSMWSWSLVGDASTTESLCVAHWQEYYWRMWLKNVIKRLRPLHSSMWLVAYPSSFLCQFFVGMKCLCNVQLTRDQRRSEARFD